MRPITKPSSRARSAYKNTPWCFYCGRLGSDGKDWAGRPWHLDHVHPKSKGGKDMIANYAQACRRCNIIKNDAIGWPKGGFHVDVDVIEWCLQIVKGTNAVNDRRVLFDAMYEAMQERFRIDPINCAAMRDPDAVAFERLGWVFRKHSRVEFPEQPPLDVCFHDWKWWYTLDMGTV